MNWPDRDTAIVKVVNFTGILRFDPVAKLAYLSENNWLSLWEEIIFLVWIDWERGTGEQGRRLYRHPAGRRIWRDWGSVYRPW